MPIPFEDRAEFASDRWIEVARAYLEQRVQMADERIETARFSICEILSDAPAHFNAPGGVAAWHAILDGRKLTVGSGVIENADFEVRGDYHAVAQIGRTFYGADKEATQRKLKEVTHRLGGPAAKSESKGQGGPAVGFVFGGMHDFMAARTVDNWNLPERLARQGLTRHAEELRTQGYTILERAMSEAFTDELRATILDRIAETSPDSSEGGSAGMLLERGAIFEETALQPYLLSLAESLCGKGMLLSQLLAVKAVKGGRAIGLHTDYVHFPEPFPETPHLCTAIWAMEDFTVDGGCTWVVPGTQRMKRHPTPHDDLSQAVPLIMPKGSIAIWDGALWHWQGERKLGEERVTLHSTYTQSILRPYDDYLGIDPEILDRNPPELATLTGQDDIFSKNTKAGQQRELFMRAGAVRRSPQMSMV